jgi:hypothetical protein
VFAAGVAAALTLTAIPAAAQDEPIAEESRNQRARQILERLDEAGVRDVRESESNWRSNFALQKKGLEYRHALTVGERDMILSVYGPMTKKKTFGLGFRIRF